LINPLKTYAFLLLLILTFSCKNDLNTISKEKVKDLSITEEYATDIEIYFSENAQKKSILRAPVMVKKKDTLDKTMFPEGIYLEMYQENGALGSTLRAKYGAMDHISQEMTAKDSVVVISSNGQSLRCKHLTWNQQTRMLQTNGSVALKTQTETIYGDTLTADENLRIYKIKHITGIVQVKK
jgi:LPS export ABC transporter protein LptC